MKILVNAGFEQYWKKEFSRISNKFPDLNFVFVNSKQETAEHLIDSDVFIGGNLSEDMIYNAKKLKAIFVPWAGVDLLPKDAIIKKNIIVSNSHGNARIVAERAFALALSLMGKVVQYHNDLQKGIWHGFAAGFKQDELWTSLWGNKCSILGLGRIGSYLAKLLKAFDCEVIGFKRKIVKIDNVDYVTNNLEEAINLSNVVFCLLPLTSYTENVLDWKILSKMSGKFLINVGRGKVINEFALYRAIKDNILAGAAIDVWYEYPNNRRKVSLPSKYPIHNFENVVVSPHVGGYSLEGQINRIKNTCDNLVYFLEQGTPKDIVDMNLGY